MKSGRLPFVLCTTGFVFVCCLAARTASGQNSAWLKANQSDPPRFEGIVDEPNARLEYEVRGLEAVPDQKPNVDARREQDPFLRIEYCRSSVPGPDDVKDKAAYILVRPNRSDLDANYIMRALQQPAQGSSAAGWKTFLWPTKTVIHPKEIDPNDLSVVIHMGASDDFAEMQPATFDSSSSEKAPEAAPTHIDSYILSFLIQRDELSSLSYTYRVGDGTARTCYYVSERRPCVPSKPAPAVAIDTGTVAKLKLDMAGMPDGVASIRIQGTYKLVADPLDVKLKFVRVRTCH